MRFRTSTIAMLAVVMTAASAVLLVMIGRHIEMFSFRGYIDAIVHGGAPYGLTTIEFFMQGPMVIFMVFAAVNWLRLMWRGIAYLVRSRRA